MQGFLDKGRMRPLLEAMPVKIIINDRTALYGSALYLAAVKQETAGQTDG
jgi:glucokinase